VKVTLSTVSVRPGPEAGCSRDQYPVPRSAGGMLLSFLLSACRLILFFSASAEPVVTPPRGPPARACVFPLRSRVWARSGGPGKTFCRREGEAGRGRGELGRARLPPLFAARPHHELGEILATRPARQFPVKSCNSDVRRPRPGERRPVTVFVLAYGLELK